ncbi:MAG: hypothetical protein O3C27_13115 [Actinomycetota bacterium]|nr:hypothetical protein [Actinomycetota bacterium]
MRRIRGAAAALFVLLAVTVTGLAAPAAAAGVCDDGRAWTTDVASKGT